MTTLNPDFILSDQIRKILDVHHPWRDLRDNWPDWQVCFGELPVGVDGCTDVTARTIWLSQGLTQAQRRSVLAHELGHVAGGHCDPDAWDEIDVEQAAARLLLPLASLLRVLPWAHDLAEAADELWVDTDLLWARLDHLHMTERAAIKRAFAARDNEETA